MQTKRQYRLCFSLLTEFLMQVSAISRRGLLGLPEGQIINNLCQIAVKDNMFYVLSMNCFADSNFDDKCRLYLFQCVLEVKEISAENITRLKGLHSKKIARILFRIRNKLNKIKEI